MMQNELKTLVDKRVLTIRGLRRLRYIGNKTGMIRDLNDIPVRKGLTDADKGIF